ncbi:nitroreductase family protein [Paracoccus sp. DMF-8]|uniref:nitroreductase family protein n=1 Tax=Paracoccus sp. DMF-8 TaxID=3019445 RepID=UPI0023E79E34|nr:nitroreductase family protein [Paracoccus sp. DMF-8]MDF3604705.1 nitroreductase family protein [Paracoccus sp. DMF-8]
MRRRPANTAISPSRCPASQGAATRGGLCALSGAWHPAPRSGRAQAAVPPQLRLFGAPVGVIVTIDRRMGAGCFMDLGMSLMAFLMAAEARGLGASGIGAMANYGPQIHQALALPGDEMVVCGIALGHPDPQAPENRFRTDRAELPDFTSFRGF